MILNFACFILCSTDKIHCYIYFGKPISSLLNIIIIDIKKFYFLDFYIHFQTYK